MVVVEHSSPSENLHPDAGAEGDAERVIQLTGLPAELIDRFDRFRVDAWARAIILEPKQLDSLSGDGGELMLRKLKHWQSAVADYTVGTIIVVAHMMTADAREQRRPVRLLRR